ncbi:dystrophin-like, partial [Saccoglossus kowalevskii]|uniref:Dystrophin-like n=1 Tax=Saccoglossus kowalevskii TaxID=10224 RepID=A0ABM0MWA1_SACKO
KIQDGIATYQNVVSSLNASGEAITSHCNPVDAQLLRHKLEALNTRWKKVCAEVSDRKERFEKETIEQEDFQEDLDDLMFWLDECEGMMNRPLPIPADDQSLLDLLEKVRDREDELGNRKDCLTVVVQNGDKLVKQIGSPSSNTLQIQRQLHTINNRWDH